MGIRNSSCLQDPRLPITLLLLHKLCSALNHTCSSLRSRTLFQLMFLLAFHAFLRVGEMTLSHSCHQNILQLDQIHFQPTQASRWFPSQSYFVSWRYTWPSLYCFNWITNYSPGVCSIIEQEITFFGIKSNPVKSPQSSHWACILSGISRF